MFSNPFQFKTTSKIELLAKQVVEGFLIGKHKSPFHGFSVEFMEHRNYNTGDNLKHIDWKLYAKTDKLFLKRFEEETNLRCQLMLDVSSSMLLPSHAANPLFKTKLDYAIYAAATFIELTKKQRDAVGLTLFDEERKVYIEPKLNQQHFVRLYNELTNLQSLTITDTVSTTNISDTIINMSSVFHKRSLVIIFSDLFFDASQSQQFKEALQILRYKKHEVILFHTINHQLELFLDLENRPIQFIDTESKEKVNLNPTFLKEAYQIKMTEHIHLVKQTCNEYKVDFIDANTNNALHDLLNAYLHKRNRMKNMR